MYLVDTNVVSEIRRRSPPAVKWLQSIDPLGIHLSVLTLGEIEKGIVLKHKVDPAAAGHLAKWLRSVRHEFADRILPVTEQISVQWGRIAALRPRGEIDGLIAATAIVHDLIIVTRNVSDFTDTGATVFDPWQRDG